MYDDALYYADQSDWSPLDYQGLWRYLNRLFQTLGPAPSKTNAIDPASLSAQIQARRTGRRDDELAAMDLNRMSRETTYLMKHMLIRTGRLEMATRRFPNLAGLHEVGELEHPLYLDDQPTFVHGYYTRVGIYL